MAINIDWHATTKDGQNALILVIKSTSREPGDIRIARSLVDHGVDVNAVDEDGQTALMHACYKRKYRHISMLLDAGADPNLAQTASLMTPLHYACENGNDITTKMLMCGGADPNQVNSEGDTALLVAAGCGNVHCIEAMESGSRMCAKRAREEPKVPIAACYF